jgi:hypothetical protein
MSRHSQDNRRIERMTSRGTRHEDTEGKHIGACVDRLIFSCSGPCRPACRNHSSRVIRGDKRIEPASKQGRSPGSPTGRSSRASGFRFSVLCVFFLCACRAAATDVRISTRAASGFARRTFRRSSVRPSTYWTR